MSAVVRGGKPAYVMASRLPRANVASGSERLLCRADGNLPRRGRTQFARPSGLLAEGTSKGIHRTIIGEPVLQVKGRNDLAARAGAAPHQQPSRELVVALSREQRHHMGTSPDLGQGRGRLPERFLRCWAELSRSTRPTPRHRTSRR